MSGRLRADRPAQYAELHCLSNFTFLRGASHPQELVERRPSSVTARSPSPTNVPSPVSCGPTWRRRLRAEAPHRRGVPPRMRAAVRGARHRPARLRAAVPPHQPRAPRGRKGQYSLTRADRGGAGLEQCFILWLPGATPERQEAGGWLAAMLSGTRVRIAVELLCEGTDRGASRLLADASAGSCSCRSSPAAMSTCIRATAAACRTRSRDPSRCPDRGSRLASVSQR